jgi:hypothetical protein
MIDEDAVIEGFTLSTETLWKKRIEAITAFELDSHTSHK